MKAFLFALALVPSWAQQTCSTLNLSCGMMGAKCDMMPNMTSHSYASCASPLVCIQSNWTCKAKPMVGTACMSNGDCQYMNNNNNMLICNMTTSMCQTQMGMMPTDGCRGIGDPCQVDMQCAYGSCRGGWCAGIDIGMNCSNENYWGCKPGAFCWSSDGSMNNATCQMKKADGVAAVWTSGGYEWSCSSGYYRNDTANMPKCVSYSAWWGKVMPGGQCYYANLGMSSHDLCTLGYYCNMTTSTCMMDTAFPATCNMFSGDCSNTMRAENYGTCSCETAGQAPVCIRNMGCPSEALLNENVNKMWGMKCGLANPSPMQGRCPAGGTYDPNWSMSCWAKAGMCWPPLSWQQCTNSFDLMHWKKVLIPSGMVCGMSPAMSWTPSFCSSASIAQPLIFVVVALMAFLRLA